MRNIACLIACLVAVAVSSSAGDGQTIVAQAPASRSTESLAAILKSRVPKDIPLLEDLAITKPGPDVTPQLVELSGAWVGKFHSERSGTLMAEWVYVIEKVTPTSLTIVSMGVGRDPGSRGGNRGNAGQLWSTRYENLKPTQVSPLLEVTNTRGTTYSYELKDGKLKVRTVSAGGGSPWVGTFEKVAW